MKRTFFNKIIALILTFILLISIIPIGSIGVSAASKGNTATYFDKLSSYINSYGSTNSNGYKTIVKSTTTSGGYTYYYSLEKRSSGIYFGFLSSSNNSSYIATNTEFILYKNSSSISVDFMMLYYYYGSCKDAVQGTKSIDRSTYSASKTYSFYKSGTYISSSDFSETFNNSLALLCTYWDTYLYTYNGYGLEELGFLNFAGKGSPVCDKVTNYHTGSTIIKNYTESTCTTLGYSGDKCCSTCGDIISYGEPATSYGSHVYSNACDESCNSCSYIRNIEGHKYKNACDNSCDNCGEIREISGHEYDDDCDSVCNFCGESRVASHSYESVVTKATLTKNGKIEKVCSKCGDKSSDSTIIRSIKTIKLSATNYSYNGSAKKPSVSIKDSAGETISSNNYTVTYASGRKNVGKYKVTVKFKGNYSGTKSLYFTINPAKTKISKLTPGKTSMKVSFTKKTSQTTGYQIQYSTNKSFKSAKTKTISSNKKSAYTLTGLKTKKIYYVRIRTYKTVGGKKYYSEWSSTISKCTSHKHSYSKATCTKAKTCKICGVTSGKALGHKSGSAKCSRCGKVLFSKLTYTGTGIGKITNINIPSGDYILKTVSSAMDDYVIDNCFIKLYNGDSRLKAYTGVTVSTHRNEISVSENDVFEGPIKNGVIKVEAPDDIKWTITIVPY